MEMLADHYPEMVVVCYFPVWIVNFASTLGASSEGYFQGSIK